MIGCLGITADQRHLDVAAGTGEPGLTVARLAPGGHVVLTDLAAEMLGIAARRADAQGITNFRERIEEAVIARVSTYEQDGKRIPGLACCIACPKRGGLAHPVVPASWARPSLAGTSG